jgi:hypothetical protein
MARAPIAAAMVGKTIGRTINELQIPVYVERFVSSKDEIFVTASILRKELGDKEFEELPTGALGLYTYYEPVVSWILRAVDFFLILWALEGRRKCEAAWNPQEI